MEKGASISKDIVDLIGAQRGKLAFEKTPKAVTHTEHPMPFGNRY
jgi:hypothetical protein